MKNSNKIEINKIIIFDGICLLCNSAVYFLHKRLRYRNYKFIASQSDTGKEYLKNFNLEATSQESIILLKNESIFTKSDVVLEIVDDMQTIWSIIKIFKIVPRRIRNIFYDFISKHRHAIFGKTNSNTND